MDSFLAALPQIVSMSLLLAISGFLSGSESALFSLTRSEVAQMRRHGGRLGALIAELLGKPRDLLAAILVGNLVVNVVYFSLAAAVAARAAREQGAGAAAFLASAALLAIIVFGEVTPKNLAVLAPARFASVSAWPMVLLLRLTGPFRALIGAVVELVLPPGLARAAPPYVTADELRLLVDLGGKRGLIEGAENELMQQVMELGEVPVREVMVPRVDMVVYEAGSAAGAEALAEAANRARSRVVPVSDGSLDRILGVIDVKDSFLEPGRPLRELVRPVTAIPANKRLDAVLRLLWEEASLAALVVDQHGGTEGFVTMDRILDELAGQRELAGEPIKVLDDGRYLLSGRLAIRDWIALFPVDALSPRWETLGGFVTFLLGHHPHEGDKAVYGNLSFVVRKVRNLRVEEVLLERSGGDAEDLPAAGENP